MPGHSKRFARGSPRTDSDAGVTETTRKYEIAFLRQGSGLLGLLTQPVDSTILRSIGSPTGVSRSWLRAWQVASARRRGPRGRWRGSGTSGSNICPFRGTTPITSKPSSVRVPVCKGTVPSAPVSQALLSWSPHPGQVSPTGTRPWSIPLLSLTIVPSLRSWPWWVNTPAAPPASPFL